MPTIKKHWAYFLLIGALIFFVYKKVLLPKDGFTVKTIGLQQGWGFDILKDDKIFIHQEIIPSIAGKKSFATQADAEKVAELMVYKLRQKLGGGLPFITQQDLDSLKITR